MDRQATIKIALGGATFDIERFDASEQLSQPYVIRAEGFSEVEIDFSTHMGKPVSIAYGDRQEVIRYFHGVLTQAEQLDANLDRHTYRLKIRPWLALLDHNRDYRIFQNKSVVDIAKEVFAKLGMNDVSFDKLTGTYAARDYCVQYKESDLHFLSRLFEQEGIYYYFKHEETAHTLILCDGKSAHSAASGYDQIPLKPVASNGLPVLDTLAVWSERISSGGEQTVSLRSYDFIKPPKPVEAKSVADNKHPGPKLEVYEYRGDFTEATAGNTAAKVHLDGIHAQRRQFHGRGDVPGLACGGLFKLTSATVGRYNREYLITAVRHVVEADAYRSGGPAEPRRVEIDAIPSDVVFRPPMVTEKPRATGPETATVTGPSGQVIYTDEYGRVKVRFHWDRGETEPPNSSCWIRVSHPSAGKGFGHVALPRVDQEVIVDFLDGDPDRPIVTGRVYHALNKHTYGLPGMRTRSLWRSETIGETGDYGGAEKAPPATVGFNEIRFEDAGGKEELYIHAQRDRVTDVLLDDKLTVQRDRLDRYGRDRKVEIRNDDKLTIEEGNQAIQLKTGNLETLVDTGNMKTEVKTGNVSTEVSTGNFSVKTSIGKVTIEAMDSITLTVGGNSITIDQTGVQVKGLMIKSEADTTHTIKGGAMTQIDGGGMTIVKGGIVTIN